MRHTVTGDGCQPMSFIVNGTAVMLKLRYIIYLAAIALNIYTHQIDNL